MKIKEQWKGKTLVSYDPILGERRIEVDKIQAKNEKRIENKRDSILDLYERKWRDGEFKSQEDIQQFMTDTVIPFNRAYPDRNFIISAKTLAESLKRRAGIRALTVEGVQLDKKTAAKDLAAQRAFVQ